MKSVQPNAGRNRSFNPFVLNGNFSPSGDAPQGAQDDSWRGKISRSWRAGGADAEGGRGIWVMGVVGDASVCSLRKKNPSPSLFVLHYKMPQPARRRELTLPLMALVESFHFRKPVGAPLSRGGRWAKLNKTVV